MTEAYGDYILRTGKGAIGQCELLVGSHWYHSRFAGMRPILDVGPGRCWFTKQAPSDIIAIDNSPEIVAHFKQQGLDIRIGDANALPIDDGSVEAVFCCWLIEHLERPEIAFREFRRVLRAGGYACIIAPTPHDMSAFYDDYTHVRPFTATSLGQLAEDSGFSKHQAQFLPWVRGIRRVLTHLGQRPAAAYLRLADRYLRRVGLLNRNNIMLEVWK